MTISIIIPTLNEAEHIGRLVEHLRRVCGPLLHELFVCDGGSTDDTLRIAEAAGATVLRSPQKGRAAQMIYATAQATGDVLYYVHADTLPPQSCLADIQAAVEEGYQIGCFRFRFRSESWLLRINSYFTRFDKMWCRGGDQSLFITRGLYDELGGYRRDFFIMEEYDLIARARSVQPFKIIPKDVLVSARKYDTNGYLRVQVANLIVFNMYRLGYSQQVLANTYARLLNYRYGRRPYEGVG